MSKETGRADRSGRVYPLLKMLLITFGVIVTLFAGYEVVENLWLTGLDMQTLHMLHRIRGLLAALVAASLGGWFIIRESQPLLTTALSPEEWTTGTRSRETERVDIYTRWFIQMRWIATIVAFTLIVVTVRVAQLLPLKVWWPLILTVATLAGLNLVYTALLKRGYASRGLLVFQAYTDLILLTVLLHFSGSIENPLAPLMLFHVVIAGIILSRRQCFSVAIVGGAIFATLAGLELTGVLRHYTLEIFPHQEHAGALTHAAREPLYVASHVTLHATILLLTAFFVTTLADRLRRDERQLERYAERLAREITEQKRTQADLMRAEKLAAVGEMAGEVAHEVNNPVAIISAKARLLLANHRKEISEGVAGELTKITDMADRITKITQGLLSYSRPSAGARQEMDARMAIRAALSLVEQRVRHNEVRIEDRLPAEPLPVMANADELEQVFLNVFLNSVDAMPEGGTLTVSATSTNSEHAIAVEDTGTGVDTDILERVFEPFFTTKPEGKGTGLGLSICVGLIRSHGGSVELTSDPERGTEVIVKLPAHVPEQGTEQNG